MRWGAASSRCITGSSSTSSIAENARTGSRARSAMSSVSFANGSSASNRSATSSSEPRFSSQRRPRPGEHLSDHLGGEGQFPSLCDVPDPRGLQIRVPCLGAPRTVRQGVKRCVADLEDHRDPRERSRCLRLAAGAGRASARPGHRRLTQTDPQADASGRDFGAGEGEEGPHHDPCPRRAGRR